ncbi:MAG: dockerin type I domain-containing protein [Clostridia bacterium]|nr:dockerin type I domain-containing protein [Clostridia bacterium]
MLIQKKIRKQIALTVCFIMLFCSSAIIKTSESFGAARPMIENGTELDLSPTQTPVFGIFVPVYIAPDVIYPLEAEGKIKSGFKVTFVSKYPSTYQEFTVYTDETGFAKNQVLIGTYDIIISKNGYLTRTIKNVYIKSPPLSVGSKDSPISIWPGDVEKDDAINMGDIVKLIQAFNTAEGDINYNSNFDLNMDRAVNMADILVIVNHFNTTSEDYLEVFPPVTPPTQTINPTPEVTPTSTPTITVTPTPTPVWKRWEPGRTYVKGVIYNYKEKLYECMITHMDSGWLPDSTPALWRYIMDVDTDSIS